MSAREELHRTLNRIHAISTVDAPLARRTAEATRGIMARCNVGKDEYGTWRVTEENRPFCIDVTDRIRVEVEAEQCRIRDAALKVLAAEMESLRTILPSLAARAAIEVGVTARALQAETMGGQP